MNEKKTNQKVWDKDLFPPSIESILTKEPKISIFGRLCIITYELGDLYRDLFYAYRLPNEKRAHLANAKLDLGELFVQLSILCKELGFDEKELRELGWQHLKDKFEELSKRGWVPL